MLIGMVKFLISATATEFFKGLNISGSLKESSILMNFFIRASYLVCVEAIQHQFSR